MQRHTDSRAGGETGTQNHTEVKAAYLVDPLRIRLEKERTGEQLGDKTQWVSETQADIAGKWTNGKA